MARKFERYAKEKKYHNTNTLYILLGNYLFNFGTKQRVIYLPYSNFEL